SAVVRRVLVPVRGVEGVSAGRSRWGAGLVPGHVQEQPRRLDAAPHPDRLARRTRRPERPEVAGLDAEVLTVSHHIEPGRCLSRPNRHPIALPDTRHRGYELVHGLADDCQCGRRGCRRASYNIKLDNVYLGYANGLYCHWDDKILCNASHEKCCLDLRQYLVF